MNETAPQAADQNTASDDHGSESENLNFRFNEYDSKLGKFTYNHTNIFLNQALCVYVYSVYKRKERNLRAFGVDPAHFLDSNTAIRAIPSALWLANKLYSREKPRRI